MRRSSSILSQLATTTLVVVLFFFSYSCRKEQEKRIEAVEDRGALPGLSTKDITTVISDSGITRYRIYADIWNIYDRAEEPYWDFPKGIHFEKFNENLVVDANFHSKKGKYLEYKKLWEFKDSVRAVNLNGDMFETELLYWDQQKEKIYSDQFIKVIQPERIITAIGFESDQSMTKYHFKNIQGVFAVEENEDEDEPISE